MLIGRDARDTALGADDSPPPPLAGAKRCRRDTAARCEWSMMLFPGRAAN